MSRDVTTNLSLLSPTLFLSEIIADSPAANGGWPLAVAGADAEFFHPSGMPPICVRPCIGLVY